MAKNFVTRAWVNIREFLARPHTFVMSVHAESLLEDFFVSAVTSLLAIRFYLHSTGFPQLAPGPLHIAHMLWGGLAMLIALFISLAFLDHSARVTAAVVGGIGFGAFIDELGKFITGDNDYFFQPAVALIYVVFVLIFLVIRALASRQSLSSEACLANALDIAKQGSLSGLDEEERAYALELLETCPPSPVRENLETILDNTRGVPPRPTRLLTRLHVILDTFYRWAVPRWWFGGIIIAFFALTAVTSLYAVVTMVGWLLALILWTTAGVTIVVALVLSHYTRLRHLGRIFPVSIVIISILISWVIMGNLEGMPLSIIDWAKFVFPSISGLLIAMGILVIPRSRLQAYLMFRRAILVSIFLTQVFAFYEQQLLALLGLILDILILVGLRYLIAHEETRGGKRATSEPSLWR